MLATLNQATGHLREKSENAWLARKRVSHSNSLDSFSSYAGESLRNAFARASSVATEKTSNSVGAVASISKLLVSKERLGDIVRGKSETAKTKLSSGMKKAFSFAGTRIRRKDEFPTLQSEPIHNDEGASLGDITVEVEADASIDSNTVEPLSLELQEAKQPTVPKESKPIAQSSKRNNQTPTECFMCEKLITCNLRTELSPDEGEEFQDVAPCKLFSDPSRIR
jgi:hypothetical protein